MNPRRWPGRMLDGLLSVLPAGARREISLLRGERWRARREPSYLVQREDWDHFFRRAFMALRFNGIDGDYAEFGCAGGRTFALAYHAAKRAEYSCRMWAFDSFAGLPPQSGPEDEHPAWVEGTMRTDLDRFHSLVASHGVPRDAYEVVPGYYETTLTAAASDARLPSNIALAYIDCDLYSSTRTVLGFLRPRLKHGMILAFDDYYCYSATQVAGERRACAEAFGSDPDWVLVPYVQYGWHGMSFIVESRNLGGGASATF